MIRCFLVLLLAGIGVTQYQLWLGRSSVFRLEELEAQLEAKRRSNDLLRTQNEALAAELYSLENRRDAIEERARWDLTMVKNGEVLFRLHSEGKGAAPAAGATDPGDMPDYREPDIKPGSEPTFDAKKSDLYHAPKHLSAPKSRDRRE